MSILRARRPPTLDRRTERLDWAREQVDSGAVTVGGFRIADPDHMTPDELVTFLAASTCPECRTPAGEHTAGCSSSPAAIAYRTHPRAEPIDDMVVMDPAHVFLDDGHVDVDAMRAEAAAIDTSGLDVFREEFTRIDGTGLDVGIVHIEDDPRVPDHLRAFVERSYRGRGVHRGDG